MCEEGIKLDKFLEAFEPFEHRVNVDKIETFRQLAVSFASFAGGKWRGTRRQIDTLAVEAQRIGIPVHCERERKTRYSPWISQLTWKSETSAVRGKSQQRYRDIKKGRFIKKT